MDLNCRLAIPFFVGLFLFILPQSCVAFLPASSSSNSAAILFADQSAVAEPSAAASVSSGASVSASDDVAPDDQSTAEESSTQSAFIALSNYVSNCIIQSDIKRIKGLDGASTGWTSWVDDEAAFRLQACIDLLCLSSPPDPTDVDALHDEDMLSRRDEAVQWTKWMRACPAPLVIDLSDSLREAVNGTVRDEDLIRADIDVAERQELLDRVGLRLILLPSGRSLQSPIRTPAGAMAYGKLLFGGATRFRLLSGGKYGTPRRAGERTVIQSRGTVNERSWLQYGGPERNYEAVDVGPCAILETIILPKGLMLESMHDDEEEKEMALSNFGWDPNVLLDYWEPDDDEDANTTVEAVYGEIRHGTIKANIDQGTVLESTLSTAVGGCREEIAEIVRRACQGRVLSDELGVDSKECELEAAELAALGLSPVRGVLLYGPPGCGKARNRMIIWWCAAIRRR